MFCFLFRILNKLSPEKFDKLSLELLNVGIDSQVILKGIILLVSIISVNCRQEKSQLSISQSRSYPKR